MIESTIENYIVLEAILGGIIIVLLCTIAMELEQIIELLKKRNKSYFDTPVVGSTTDFLRKKK